MLAYGIPEFRLPKAIVKAACDNFENRRPEQINLVEGKVDLVAGFSHETINYLLGGSFRASYRPLNDNIIRLCTRPWYSRSDSARTSELFMAWKPADAAPTAAIAN